MFTHIFLCFYHFILFAKLLNGQLRQKTAKVMAQLLIMMATFIQQAHLLEALILAQ